METPPDDEYCDFVRTRSVPLLHLAFWMTGNWHDAEEITQDALVNTYLRWRHAKRPDAYVRRIVINASRRRFSLRRREVLVADLPEDRDPTTDAEAVSARRALLTALATLPRRQRAVVILRYCQDQPEEEVAAAMGCSIGTVKSQASRALAKLRAHPALASEESETAHRGGDSQ